jgi:hypothetical protein
VVREMQMDRYEFLLDEMIKRRNSLKDLRRKARAPYNIHREALLSMDK